MARTDIQRGIDAYFSRITVEMEAAALETVKVGARRAVMRIRDRMQGAGLGRLGNALGNSSDGERGLGVRHTSSGGFTASGVVFIRSGSRRARGALQAYTEGAEIRPKRSRWLWIATDEIPRLSRRYRMTPERYVSDGFEQKIGKLVYVRSINGYPLLVVKSATVSAVGKRRSAKANLKSGRPGKGQRPKEFIVAFIGIPRTSRAARVNIPEIMQQVTAELPELFSKLLGKS